MKLDIYNYAMNETKTYKDFVSCFTNGCDRCSLSEHNKNHPVLYRGNLNSDIMLIGEAPGLEEWKVGQPFTGPAGEQLDRLFSAPGVNMNTDRDLILSNIVLCRPIAPYGSGKQNYTPLQKQIARCWPFGLRAIELINPAIIICCGKPAMQTVLDLPRTSRISDLEGRWTTKNGRYVFIMRHTANVLYLKDRDHDEYTRVKYKMWEYMKEFSKTKDEKIASYRSKTA